MTYTVIDLPMPPSLNSIWRYSRERKKPYLSDRYKSWKRVAENLFLANRKQWTPVEGKFTAIITIDEKRRRANADIDNRAKVCLDFLQRVRLIENDSLCDRLTVEWGFAPEGCRVVLTPVSASVRRAA